MEKVDPNIFREYDIRGLVGRQLSDETVRTIGLALGTFFRRNRAETIAIGYDARESSPRFETILIEALNSTGCDAVSIGMVPTPVLYHAVHTTEVDGGIMITGSHNPPDHNGFKVCLGRDALFGEQIREIGGIAERGEFSTGTGTHRNAEHIKAYLDDLIARFKPSPRTLKAVIDAGNGVGGITAVPLYEAMGVELVKLFIEPDARFPNHHPDPTVEANMQDLVRTVRESGADIGIAFDGDGDRIGVVDETGRIIWGDELLIPVSRELLAAHPGAAIIAEVKCSQSLFDDIESRGGKAIMCKAGHSIIKAKMKETGALLAGEMSGHFFFADRYYGFDDGAYAGARMLELLATSKKKLSQLFDGLPALFNTPELRVKCPDDIKFEVVRRLADKYSVDHNVISIDGARIEFSDGWGLVRPSNTQAMLVLRFEAATENSLESIRDEVEKELDHVIKVLTQ